MTPLIFGFLRPPWFNSSKRRPWFVALAKIWRKRYSCTQKTFVSNKKSRHDTPRATILLGPCISPTLQPKLAYDTFISQVTIFLEKLEGSPYNFPIQWLNHVLTLQDIELMGFLLRFLCLFLTRDPVIFLENIIFMPEITWVFCRNALQAEPIYFLSSLVSGKGISFVT